MAADPSIPESLPSVAAEAVPVREADHWQLERTAKHLSLQFTTNTNQLRNVRLTIESFCRDGGLDEKCWSEIGFVVNEAVANITRHAYDAAGPMPVDLNADLTAEGVTISLRDWGKGEVPSAKNLLSRNRNAQSGESIPEPGGLGLMCMKRLMSDVTFIPQHPGMLLHMSRPRQC